MTRISTADIARLSGVSIFTVRKDAREGVVDRRNLKSVIEYLKQRSCSNG